MEEMMMTDISFKKVADERRVPYRESAKYSKLWDALERGDTLELAIDGKDAARIRAAWKGGSRHRSNPVRMLRVVASGGVYLAWLDPVK